MDLIDPKGEHYNLRWNNYSNNLIQVFSEHQHQEILVDTTLICEREYVRAHKLILSACSGFFQEMFKNYGHVSNPFIVLNGIKLAHLRHIIEFIYHGEIKVLDTDLEGVLALGEHFQVKGLCSVKVKQSSNPKELNSVASTTVSTSEKLPTTTTESNNTQKKVSCPKKLSDHCDSTPSRTVCKESKTVLKGSHTSDYQNSFEKNLKARLAQLTNSEQPAKKKKIQILVKGGTSYEKKYPLVNKILDKENKEEQKIIVKPGGSSDKDLQKHCSESVPDRDMLESASPVQEEVIDQKTETIPRPVNAFMIFANEWRKKLSVEHPGDNSKSISVRLGNLWKSLSAETRESYYSAARQAQLEHQLKYPGYYGQVPTTTRVKVTARRKTVESVDYSVFSKDSDDDLQIVEHHLEDSAYEANMPHSPTT